MELGWWKNPMLVNSGEQVGSEFRARLCTNLWSIKSKQNRNGPKRSKGGMHMMVKCMCQHALSRRFLDSQCSLAKCFVFFFAAAAPKKRQVPLGPWPYDSGPLQQILLVLLLTQKWQFFKLKTKGWSQKIPEFSNLRTHVLLFLCVLFDGEEKVRKGLSMPTSFESFFGGLVSLSKIKSGLICGLTPLLFPPFLFVFWFPRDL